MHLPVAPGATGVRASGGRTSGPRPPGQPAPGQPAPGLRMALAGVVEVCCTGVDEGDMAERGEAGNRRRSDVVDLPWVRLAMVHGAGVAVVDRPGDGDGVQADAAVTASPGVALAVLTADCAPVALGSPEGVVGVAHAGWRGLLAGVVGATVDAMVALGASRIEAVVGPCIEAACYEWDPDDLQRAVSHFGPSIASRTAAGRPAFDLRAGVRTALDRAGVARISSLGSCTACSPGWWSWRARGDSGRQATVAWLR